MKNIILFMLTMLAGDTYCAGFTNLDSTVIRGRTGLLHNGDTVSLHIVKYGDFYIDKELNSTFISVITNNEYTFSIPAPGFPVYFSLILSRKDPRVNLNFYLIEADEDVQINSINPDSIQFSGKGAQRLKIQYENKKKHVRCLNRLTDWTPPNIKQTFTALDSCALGEIAYLKANKKILGERLYTILVADILGESGLKIDNFLPYHSPNAVEVWRKALIDYKNIVWEKNNQFNSYNNFLQYSYTYANALIAKYKWDSCVIIKKPFSVSNCYAYFKKNYRGSLRGKIVTTLLYKNRNKNEDISYCLKTSLSYVENSDFKRILLSMDAHLTKGSIAYKFKLPDTNGVIQEWSSFKGKIILLDFWFTGCTGCIQIKPKIDSVASLYKTDQIVFVSICIDKNKDQWINSVNKNIYTSKHSINLYTDGKGDNHPIISHYLISTYPKLILIDKNGKLCNNPIDPRIDNGRNLIDLIEENLKTPD